MRFLLIAFTLTLFLIASASQIDPPSYSPEVTACIKGLNDIEYRMNDYQSRLAVEMNLAGRDYKKVIQFLNSKGNSGSIDFGDTETLCMKVTSPSKDEKMALKKAFDAFNQDLYFYEGSISHVIALFRNAHSTESQQAGRNLIKAYQLNSFIGQRLYSTSRGLYNHISEGVYDENGI